MKIRTLLSVVATVAALSMATGTEAQAAFGVFNFASTINSPAGGVHVLPGGNSSFNYTTNAGNGVNGALTGGADVIIGRVDFNPGATPTTFTPYTSSFDYSVTVTDVDSGDSGAVTATGTFQGMYVGGGNAAVNAQLIGYTVAPSVLNLGGTTYVISTAASAGPGSSDDLGVLRLNVQAIPEPGSMALVGVGIVGLMGLRWRRRLQTETV